MELNIKRIKESDYQKIFVLTDIHGRFDLFKKMIRKIKLKKKDLLLILGDSCDRGEFSFELYNWYKKMIQKGYNIIHLMGNHENMLFESISDENFRLNWLYNGGNVTIKSFFEHQTEEKTIDEYWKNNKFYEEIKDFKDSKLCSLYEPIIFAVKNKNKYTFNYQDILVETKTGAKRKLIDYRKSPPAPYNDKKVPGNVWHFPRVRYKMKEYVEHPSQKPESLLERIVKVSSNEGSTVLDLFAGSFSLGRVCKRLSRNYIGVEKSTEYSKLGNLRLKNRVKNENLK